MCQCNTASEESNCPTTECENDVSTHPQASDSLEDERKTSTLQSKFKLSVSVPLNTEDMKKSHMHLV